MASWTTLKLLVPWSWKTLLESPAFVRSTSFGIYVAQTNHRDCGKGAGGTGELLDGSSTASTRRSRPLLQHGFIFLTIFLEMNKSIWNKCTFEDVYGKAGVMEKVILSSNIRGSVWVGGNQSWLNSLPIFQELVCAEMLIFLSRLSVCPLLCGNEVDLIHILLSSCENAFHLLRNTANVM